jgi:EAL domain-containing protein (putative c-di-GMP-specific phosphodiesterase class I)
MALGSGDELGDELVHAVGGLGQLVRRGGDLLGRGRGLLGTGRDLFQGGDDVADAGMDVVDRAVDEREREFLAAVEQTNFSRALTLRMLDLAARDWSRWSRAGLDVPVAVNLAAVNLIDEAFPGDVSDVLRTHGMPPERLILEVTETTVITDPVRALSVLNALRGRGIHIALDDFGTEHSSLSHLHTLPVDEIKIDRSFVRCIADDERTAAIVALARTLGLRCVAEGVEDRATGALLADIGCECVQGFFFARPMPADTCAPGRWTARPSDVSPGAGLSPATRSRGGGTAAADDRPGHPRRSPHR